MPTPGRSDEQCRAAVELVKQHGSITEAARQSGVSRETLKTQITDARRRWPDCLPPSGGSADWARAAVPISQDENKPDTATREEIIADILRVVEQDTTVVVTRNHFRNESRFAESAWISHFGTWDEAKRQAGVTLSRHAHRLGLQIAKHASVDRAREMNVEKASFEGKYLRPSSKRWQSTLVASDMHGLHCDPFFLRVFLDTALRLQPEHIVLNGDIIDAAEFSKHTQDPRQFKVVEEIRWLHKMLADVRVVAPNAQIDYPAGNHESRLLRHLSEQTPAMMVVLSDLHGFTVSKLLGLDRFEINYIDRGDMSAWNERDIAAQLRKNYVTLFDKSLLFGHFPEMRSMGIPGANGHHHKHIVWPFYSPTYGSYEWHQTGCGHVREASYCAAEKWSEGFLICHTDTLTKRTQFEYIDVSHSASVVGGKFYERDAKETILDLAA